MRSPHTDAEPPVVCDVCESARVRLIKSRTTYSAAHAEWPYRYHCGDCGASVGCHAHTLSPLGKMASRKVRKMRVVAHQAFDPLWQGGLMTRTEAYQWLAALHGMEYPDCHIGTMTCSQLELTIEVSKKQRNVLIRRMEKGKRRHEKRSVRQRLRNNRGGRRRR